MKSSHLLLSMYVLIERAYSPRDIASILAEQGDVLRVLRQTETHRVLILIYLCDGLVQLIDHFVDHWSDSADQVLLPGLQLAFHFLKLEEVIAHHVNVMLCPVQHVRLDLPRKVYFLDLERFQFLPCPGGKGLNVVQDVCCLLTVIPVGSV